LYHASRVICLLVVRCEPKYKFVAVESSFDNARALSLDSAVWAWPKRSNSR
jgi:hypothetical protein